MIGKWNGAARLSGEWNAPSGLSGKTRSPLPTSHSLLTSKGFSLVEMIMVIVITGIIGSMVAVFLKAPIQQYMDVARRADMTDIADTALRRISRDLRLALPNSLRVTGTCDGTATCFLEFLPTGSSSCASNMVCIGGGRYRAGTGGTNDDLDFVTADTSFEVLGTMPTMVAGASPDQIVMYNLGIPGVDAYAGSNRTPVSAVPAGAIANITSILFPFDSPGRRFHVISTPVSYACDGAGTLWRYSGYAIQAEQTSVDSIAELDALATSKARLATKVSSCRFTYDPLVTARNGLVTMHLAIAEEGETVTLYNAAHVSNQP